MLPTQHPHADGPEELICPQCGMDATHVDVVDVTAAHGTLRVEVPGEGDDPVVSMLPDTERGRRHTIGIRVDCESGCRTILSFQQHKGTTFVRSIRIASPFRPDGALRGRHVPVALRSPYEA